jgi:hypothetical protein
MKSLSINGSQSSKSSAKGSDDKLSSNDNHSE